MSEQATKSKLAEMAQLALLSHRISEVHEKNLKMYPLVFFDGVKSCEINYDLQDKPNFIKFDIVIVDANPPELNARFSHLESAVKTLFWKDINVIVKFNGEKVYESKNGK